MRRCDQTGSPSSQHYNHIIRNNSDIYCQKQRYFLRFLCLDFLVQSWISSSLDAGASFLFRCSVPFGGKHDKPPNSSTPNLPTWIQRPYLSSRNACLPCNAISRRTDAQMVDIHTASRPLFWKCNQSHSTALRSIRKNIIMQIINPNALNRRVIDQPMKILRMYYGLESGEYNVVHIGIGCKYFQCI